MPGGVGNPADIQINRHPGFDFLFIERSAIVIRIDITQKIP